MKRQTTMALAAVFAMSVAGTALATPVNPFVDVPAKHWSYDSINQLAKAGVISGYGDGTYQGDKTLTRYEAATLVAKAMANADKLNPENKKALEALKTEFSAELSNLGVRVSNIENRLDNVKINGEVRLRYTHEKTTLSGQAAASTITNQTRSRIGFTGQINDQWSYNARIQNTTDNRHATGATNDSNTALSNAYVSGKIFGGTYKLGRQDVFILDGLVMDNTTDSGFKGAVVNYTAGKVDLTALRGSQDTAAGNANQTYTAFAATTKAGKVDLGAAYHNFTNRPANQAGNNVWQVSAAVPLTPELGFSVGYAKSNAADDNKAYTLKLSYKSFDQTQAGSFGAWVQYRRLEANSVGELCTYDVANINSGGAKAWEVGFDYAPWKNVQFETYYVTGESLKDSSKDKYLASYLRFFF